MKKRIALIGFVSLLVLAGTHLGIQIYLIIEYAPSLSVVLSLVGTTVALFVGVTTRVVQLYRKSRKTRNKAFIDETGQKTLFRLRIPATE